MNRKNITQKPIYSKTASLILAAVLVLSIVGSVISRAAAANIAPIPSPIINGEQGFHVIVTSGEPEGVAAAVAAARNGMKTLLIENGDALGGLMTLGKLNIIDQSYLGRLLLTQGIFQEFYHAVGDAFDIGEAKDWFLNAVKSEPNITLMLNTEIISPIISGNTITGLKIREAGSPEIQTVYSLAVIDATVDGDIAAAAGAPYTWGAQDHGQHGMMQGVTLVFEISGVDWMTVVNHFRHDGSPITGADEKRAWGFADKAINYVSVDGNMRFRGPNFARQNNGNVLLNALIIFGVDALDPVSRREGIDRGIAEIPHVIEFMRENFIGFENIEFVEHASRLYVRETRHFIGEYRLTITDLLENRDHWDSIGHSRYPVDLQPSSPDDMGTIVGVPIKFSLPFRSLVPLEIEQLLVVGRAASFDSLPHGSTRVIPTGMVGAQAAGTAVAYSVNNNVTFREMTQRRESIRWLQNQLRRQGAYIAEFEAPIEPIMNHWAYPGVVVLRKLAMADGGYFNDYRLDNPLTSRWPLQNRFNQMMRVIHERTADRGIFQIPDWQVFIDSDDITVGALLTVAARGASLGDPDFILQRTQTSHYEPNAVVVPPEYSDARQAKEYLIERGVLDMWNLVYFQDLEKTATLGQVMSILGNLYNILMQELRTTF